MFPLAHYQWNVSCKIEATIASCSFASFIFAVIVTVYVLASLFLRMSWWPPFLFELLALVTFPRDSPAHLSSHHRIRNSSYGVNYCDSTSRCIASKEKRIECTSLRKFFHKIKGLEFLRQQLSNWTNNKTNSIKIKTVRALKTKGPK